MFFGIDCDKYVPKKKKVLQVNNEMLFISPIILTNIQVKEGEQNVPETENKTMA